jgi:hypothetical protein
LPHGRKKPLAALPDVAEKLKRDAGLRCGAGFASVRAGDDAMIPAIGLAMGALSTVSSVVDQAAASVSSAINPPPAPPAQTFVPSPASPKQASLPSMPLLRPGPPIPKFDKRSHSALLAAQEHHVQHRRHV